MEFIPAKCPSCGGDLMLPKNKDDAICTYCGSNFLVKDAPTNTSPSVDILLKLAKAAQNAENSTEAYNYYNKVLELAPENIDGWMGKAEMAGWQSTLANERLVEMSSGFDHVLSIATEKDQLDLRRRISQVLTSVGNSYFLLSYKHLGEFWEVDDTWSEFILNCNLLVTLANKAFSYDETNTDALLLKITISSSVLEPFKNIQNNLKLKKATPPEFRQMYLEFFNESVEKMLSIDPSFTPPKLQQDKCFIATATMGDQNHPHVVSLRNFRDTVLLQNNTGTRIVNIYYYVSPFLAGFITKSPILRKISLLMVIKPWSWIAGLFSK